MIRLKNNFSRLETGRDHGDFDSFPAGEEGRGGVHLHRGEQRGQTPVSGLLEGDREAESAGAVQPHLPCGPGGGRPHLSRLRRSSP